MEYLVQSGIEKVRLTYKGFGETQILNDCASECAQFVASIGISALRQCELEQVLDCSEEDHHVNRRITFKITKF